MANKHPTKCSLAVLFYKCASTSLSKDIANKQTGLTLWVYCVMRRMKIIDACLIDRAYINRICIDRTGVDRTCIENTLKKLALGLATKTRKNDSGQHNETSDDVISKWG